MKNLFKTVLFAAVGAVAFVSCNNKDDFDYEGEKARVLKEEEAVVTLLEEQKIKIEEYVLANFDAPIEDKKTITFEVLDRKDVKRGIWYEILSPATDDTYEYKLNANQSNVIFPTWKLNYSVKLLNSKTPVQSDLAGGTYNMSAPSNANIFTQAWIISLFPSVYKVNGDIPYLGLTDKGMKKGAKIRVIVPSIYGYGAKAADKIPANSPLVYEFEVLGVE